jgi:hypothetical protein
MFKTSDLTKFEDKHKRYKDRGFRHDERARLEKMISDYARKLHEKDPKLPLYLPKKLDHDTLTSKTKRHFFMEGGIPETWGEHKYYKIIRDNLFPERKDTLGGRPSKPSR